MAQTPHGTFDYEPNQARRNSVLGAYETLRRRYRGAPVWRPSCLMIYLIPQLVKRVQALPPT